MRFTESTPSLIDSGRVFAVKFFHNATFCGVRALNETLASLETLTGGNVFEAAVSAVEPGGAVSVLAVTFSLLVVTRMILIRRAADISMEAHSDLR